MSSFYPPLYKGATGGAAGIPGLVPPAAAGDNLKLLRGDGTWVTGGGGGGGDVSSNTSTSVVNELALFQDTGGKTIKRSTGTGIATLTSGVLSATSTTGSGNVVLATSATLVTPALGTPSAAVLTNATGLPISSGVSGLGTGVATFLATPSSANLASAITDETGSGALVFGTSPTLTTPTISGIETVDGAIITTENALGGTAINVSKRFNTKTVAIDTTFTFSGTPATDTWFELLLTNSDTASHTVTIPSSFSVNRGGAITTVTLPASGKLLLTWQYDGSAYNIYGDPAATTGTGSYVLATSPTLVTPVLGTPSSGTLTNCTGLPVSSGISGLGTGVGTFLATPTSANLAAALTDETGSGAAVFATSPTLVTPLLGVPTSGTLTNCTSLPVSTGISGLGTGVGTFLATPTSANLASALTDETGSGAAVFATSPTLVTPLLGTPTSGTLTNCTGLPISSGVSGLGTGVGTFLATPSGANLASALTTALTVNKGGSGATTLTGVLIGNGTSAFTTVTAPAGTIVGTSDTQTLTNKRNTVRVTTITSSATPTINTDNCDAVTITAQAAAITSMTTNLTGTPVNFDQLVFRIKDDGTGRAITWGASFASRGATLPTTTTASKVTYVMFLWNSVASTWDCVSASTEA